LLILQVKLMNTPELTQAEKYLNSGQQHLDFGIFPIALNCFEQAIALNSELAEAWDRKAATLRKLGRHEEAIAASEEAIALRMNVIENNAVFWLIQGHLQVGSGDLEAGIKLYDEALKINPEYTRALADKGASLNNLKRYSEALKLSIKAIDIDPEYAHAWYVKGYAQEHLGLHEEAIVSHEFSIELNPKHDLSCEPCGRILVEAKRYEEAIIKFDQAIKFNPNNEDAWLGLGNALAYLSSFEEAMLNYDRALSIKSDFALAWINRSKALMNLNRIEEAIINHEKGLIHVLKETQPEGWGELHREQGNIYRHQAKLALNKLTATGLYSQALQCYNTAQETLKNFPKPYLLLMQCLIKTCSNLGDSEAANQWKIEGLELFQQLLNAQETPQQKRKIEAEFSGFSQVTVDALVSNGNCTLALEAAERYKNRCLTWILDEWKEQVTSPSYAEMRELLNSNHEIIYWHLSEEILTTFILTPNQEIPNFLTQKSTRFESWQKDWDKRYGDYRIKGKDQAPHLASHPWRDTLKKELDRLKEILEIDKIESFLSPNTKLILIPHQDLHRFPIHALFGDERSTTCLPSIKVGLAQKPQSTSPTRFLLNVEDPARPDQPPLQFARLEFAIIQAMFAPNVKAIDSDNGDRATVEKTLQEHHDIFHFTGHGDYDSRQPEHSAIGLAGTDRLTAKEISTLNLQQYGLVCLSACETALPGMQTIHTEYVGLTSAFLQAGVSQVLSTLWTVQEVSNAYLMIRFYQFLQNKMNPAEALKRSQSWLRTVTRLELADWLIETSRFKSLDPLIRQELEQQAYGLREEVNASTIDLHHPPYADPYHWAAFTLTGRGFL
jgi:CHAT domain-containing protein/Flp pilus assembly protein TadD